MAEKVPPTDFDTPLQTDYDFEAIIVPGEPGVFECPGCGARSSKINVSLIEPGRARVKGCTCPKD